ncbi:MAG TPA: hypothetical protein VKA76_15080 [Gammaproteobacteria bacterium]|nr:hypothetical protein [Gammaproteobacteria bacterium]
MKEPVVIIGIGELGGVFARGFLRLGHPVFPLLRGQHPGELATGLAPPATVVAAVAEGDLHPVLKSVPDDWKPQLTLIQNELLPADWKRHGLTDPTVISVWFEKKPGREARVILPSPAYGPGAALLRDALATMDIPVRVLADEAQLLFELVRKNVYILTTNIAGLVTNGTVHDLWHDHQPLARAVALEVVELQESLTGERLDGEALITGMVEAFEGDPEHRCTGRSAPARLARVLQLADEYGIEAPRIREIAASHLKS